VILYGGGSKKPTAVIEVERTASKPEIVVVECVPRHGLANLSADRSVGFESRQPAFASGPARTARVVQGFLLKADRFLTGCYTAGR
jgi:hypothetical protein